MATAEPQKIELDTNLNSKVTKQNSIEFLFKEYDRLVEYQKITIEGYDRLFNVYLAVVSALLVLIVPLSQWMTFTSLSTIVNFILGGLLILGGANFVGLSYANSNCIQYERAMRLIQDAFMDDDPLLHHYLYFRVNQIGVRGSSFRALIIRGLSSITAQGWLKG